jgi:hypothetical protein
MSRVTIEVSSTHPGEAWRVHLASELALLHPGAEIRVAYGLADDAFVWSDEFGFCQESDEDERTSIVDAIVEGGRSSFEIAVLAAEDLGECVEREVKIILRAWTRAGRGPVMRVRDWMKKKVGK